MHVSEVANLIRTAKQAASIETWPGYNIKDIPFAVYDDDSVIYIDHPNPPETRPDNLVAATSTPINGVEAATLPSAFCPDEVAALPLAYHEGFHVFQRHHFAEIEVDMFTAMAFYPDLDAEYRAICRLEENALRRDDCSPDQKLRALGHLIALRRSRLTAHPSLLNYERFLERGEGTAFYVEQKARQAHFDVNPALESAGHGWSHFYKVGAALCWLLEAAVPGWTSRVEQGASPGDLIMEYGDTTFDLSTLNYDTVLMQEKAALANFRNEINPHLETLAAPDVLRIQYQDIALPMRAFNPMTLVSLGDGRVLHRTFFKLIIPGTGTVSVTQLPVIDHVHNKEIILRAVPLQLNNGTLRAQTDTVEIELEGVNQVADGVFAITPQ